VLRDVLGFRAREVAGMLDSTEESVTSALKRARAAVTSQSRAPSRPSGAGGPAAGSPAERVLVARLAAAFQAGDVDQVVALLTRDVVVSMPPMPFEYHGREAAARFFRAVAFRPGAAYRLVATGANRQPAFGVYLHEPRAAVAHANGLLVMTLAGVEVSAVTRFEAGVLLRFGLPRTLPG